MEDRISNLEKRVINIEQRNFKVESDKAWETSPLRIISISVVTYIAAAIALYIIQADNYLFGAIIPMLGFILSTLTMPSLKKWWAKHNGR